MSFELTQHAKKAVAERAIPLEWVERTVSRPELREPDPADPAVERRYRRIPEHGGRVLRVAVNHRVAPERVVSVFFDRKMKGKI